MSGTIAKRKLTFIDYFAVFSISFYALCNFNPQLLQVTLWILLPLSTIFIFLKTRTILPNIYIKYLAVLYIWYSVTAFMAYDVEVAVSSVIRTLAVFLFCYIITFLTRSFRASYFVAIVYIVFFINCIYYAKTHILEVVEMGNNFRLSDSKLNANLFGYFLFFVTFLVFHLGVVSLTEKSKRFWNIIFIGLIPLSFFIAILTASRQILILQVPYFLVLLCYRYWSGSGVLGKTFLIVLSIGAGTALSGPIIELYEDSNLYTRSQVEVRDDPRVDLANDAFKMGVEHPVFGVGPDNFKLLTSHKNFSHNSYLELFANCGIIAPIIFIAMLLKLIISQFRQWCARHDAISFSFLAFALFYFIDNIFYVFYLNTWLMGIFVFVGSLSLNKYNKFSNK